MENITPSASPEVPMNENFEALADLAVYARRGSTTTGLTWGYWGGTYAGLTVADGTLTLAASTTNYIVALKSTGVISASTATTNWNDTTNYVRCYQVVTGAATVTSYTSWRVGGFGVL